MAKDMKTYSTTDKLICWISRSPSCFWFLCMHSVLSDCVEDLHSPARFETVCDPPLMVKGDGQAKINWGEIWQNGEQQCVRSSDSLHNFVHKPWPRQILRTEPISGDIWCIFHSNAKSSKWKKCIKPQLPSAEQIFQYWNSDLFTFKRFVLHCC